MQIESMIHEWQPALVLGDENDFEEPRNIGNLLQNRGDKGGMVR